MSLFPADMPAPEPNMDDQDFWRLCAEQTLSFQACGSCATLRHPPTPICRVCHSVAVTWVAAPALGEIYTFNVIWHASHKAVEASLPYIGAVVVFPELPGVRLVSNVTGIEPGAMAIGLPVRLWWDDIGGGMHIPRFAPVAAAARTDGADRKKQQPGEPIVDIRRDNKERGT